MFGSPRRSGGMYSANIPSAVTRQLAPPSSVSHTPPDDTPTRIVSKLRGSRQTEWMPGDSSPPPNQPARSGRSHSPRTRSQLLPPSVERNSPPGAVPAHSPPAPSGSSAQMILSVAGAGGLPSPVAMVVPSG